MVAAFHELLASHYSLALHPGIRKYEPELPGEENISANYFVKRCRVPCESAELVRLSLHAKAD